APEFPEPGDRTGGPRPRSGGGMLSPGGSVRGPVGGCGSAGLLGKTQSRKPAMGALLHPVTNVTRTRTARRFIPRGDRTNDKATQAQSGRREKGEWSGARVGIL